MNGILDNPQKTNEDIDVFREIYTRYAPMLIFYASKFVDMEVAEDLVQDVFLRIWQKRTFFLLQEHIRTYLYRSVRHACLDYLKHETISNDYLAVTIKRLKIEEISLSDETHALFSIDDRIRLIYKEMEKLPEKCREIFTMQYIEEKKTAEIASLLHISPRTVEAQLYKALKLIRNALLFLTVFYHFHFLQ